MVNVFWDQWRNQIWFAIWRSNRNCENFVWTVNVIGTMSIGIQKNEKLDERVNFFWNRNGMNDDEIECSELKRTWYWNEGMLCDDSFVIKIDGGNRSGSVQNENHFQNCYEAWSESKHKAISSELDFRITVELESVFKISEFSIEIYHLSRTSNSELDLEIKIRNRSEIGCCYRDRKSPNEKRNQRTNWSKLFGIMNIFPFWDHNLSLLVLLSSIHMGKKTTDLRFWSPKLSAQWQFKSTFRNCYN